MLKASRRELERAYREHERVADTVGERPAGSHHLLLVYAVECGLKSVLMRRRRAEDTGQLGELNFGHDLRRFLKELRVPVQLDLLNCRTDQQQQQDVQPRQFHEAFRYGIRLHEEAAIVERLSAVITWLKGEIP